MDSKRNTPNEGCGLDGYIDAAEFAKRAGVTYITVWRWIRKRIVQAYKIGRHWVISADQLEKVKRYQERARANRGQTEKEDQ